MAIAAVPEAAAAVEGAGAGTAAAGEGVSAGRAGLGSAKPPAAPRARSKVMAAPGQGQDKKDRQKRPKKRGGAFKGLNAPKGRNYQPIILAEFLVAILVVAVVPVAKGGSPDAKAKNSPSPYSVGDVKQMVGIGGTYFVLALFSGSRKWGRMAAWFGALVLAALGLVQTKGGGITALFSIFGPGSGQSQVGQPISLGQLPADFGVNPDASAAVPDATGIFPTIGPGGVISDASAGLSGGLTGATVQQSFVSPPPGGTGVITTTGNDAGTNLA